MIPVFSDIIDFVFSFQIASAADFGCILVWKSAIMKTNFYHEAMRFRNKTGVYGVLQ